MTMDTLPKVIWIFWYDGWDKAPIIVRKCLETWQLHNPDWEINKLSKDNLSDYIDLNSIIPQMDTKNIQIEALSDVIRISLLYRYGGVWVDSTLYCNQPLDTWVYTSVNPIGFFAFSRPGPDRMISSWFLASFRNNYIIEQWYHQTINYWSRRREREHYFWFHYLFGELYISDHKFKNIWDEATVLSADGPHYFAPYAENFSKKITQETKSLIDHAITPVFKLTHKYDSLLISNESVLEYLLSRDVVHKKKISESILEVFKRLGFPQKSHADKPARILVTWYGAFEGNGTIGDLLSLQSLTYFLQKKGYSFDTASHKKYTGVGGNLVNWEDVTPNKYKILIFVCGPILKNHYYLPQLFNKFSSCIKIGVGVSLFEKTHFNYFNPFDHVFAREGTAQTFNDIAIVAPGYSNENLKKKKENEKELVIGISLRGAQGEYGEENCLHELTNELITKSVEILFQTRKGKVILIENHLARSGVDPSEIENLYAQCDLVITSRLHGALLALRHFVPFIAIDQIKHGAKVYGILKNPLWPFVYKAENINPESIALTGAQILGGAHQDVFNEYRKEMLEKGNHSLQKIDECLRSLV